MKFFRFVYSFKMTIAWIFALRRYRHRLPFQGQSFMFTGIAEGPKRS